MQMMAYEQDGLLTKHECKAHFQLCTKSQNNLMMKTQCLIKSAGELVFTFARKLQEINKNNVQYELCDHARALSNAMFALWNAEL